MDYDKDKSRQSRRGSKSGKVDLALVLAHGFLKDILTIEPVSHRASFGFSNPLLKRSTC